MPKSRVSRKKLFREFSKIDSKFIQENGLKNISFLYKDAKENQELGRAELEFLFFVYDLEFFTIRYVSQALGKSEQALRKRLIFKLVNDGFLYKHFDKLTPKHSVEAYYFREETKYNYRVRYAMTQRGRIIIARLYRKMRGGEQFTSLPDVRNP